MESYISDYELIKGSSLVGGYGNRDTLGLRGPRGCRYMSTWVLDLWCPIVDEMQTGGAAN